MGSGSRFISPVWNPVGWVRYLYHYIFFVTQNLVVVQGPRLWPTNITSFLNLTHFPWVQACLFLITPHCMSLHILSVANILPVFFFCLQARGSLIWCPSSSPLWVLCIENGAMYITGFKCDYFGESGNSTFFYCLWTIVLYDQIAMWVKNWTLVLVVCA